MFVLLVPTFIAFLREVESPNDVMEYVTDYLGDGKEIKSFVKQFLEKRSVLMPTGSASVTFNATVMSTTSGTSVSKKNKKKSEEVPSSATKEPVKQPASKQNSLEFTEVKVSILFYLYSFFLCRLCQHLSFSWE